MKFQFVLGLCVLVCRCYGILLVVFIKKIMEQFNVADELKVPVDFEDESLPDSVRIFRPLLFMDGDLYCCIMGADKQTGVYSCAKTQEEALLEWDKNLQDRVIYHQEDDELARYIQDTLKASVQKIN